MTEEKLKAYKTPENVVLSDKEDIAALKAEYDNLSDKTKELLDSQYIAPGESYKSRLDSLINKISALETSLSEAQKAAEHAIEYDEKIRPTYYSASGINEDYSGVAGMIRSNDFDANGLAAIRSIRQDALNKISAEKDISKLQAIKDNAIAALKDRSFVERSVSMVEEQRPKLAKKMETLGFECYPSDANFILARAPIDHAKLVEGMKKRGILIRDFGTKRRTENCVRPTVGTEELNKLMTDAMEDIIAEESR